MKSKNSLCSLVGAISLLGCEHKGKILNREIFEGELTGIPISVSYEGYQANDLGYFSIMIQKNDESYVLCKSNFVFDRILWRTSDIVDAVTIIQSEINDDDNEPIKLRGRNQEDYFLFSSISANGYYIDAIN